MMSKLEEAAKIAIKQCMNVKKNDKVLVITDTPTEAIGHALFSEAEKIANTMMLKIQPTGEHGTEPPARVGKIMREFDVIFLATEYSLSHTDARRKATKKGARIASLPGITKDIFERTVPIDYKKMEKQILRLEKAFKNINKVRIKSTSGTDLILDVKGRGRELDIGLFIERGMWGNLPAGEICLAPADANGVLVIDQMETICKPKTKVLIRNGLAQEVEGDPAFKKKLWTIKNAKKVAELGIGTNPKAILSGNVLEDEKVLGTCHIAFGDNTSYDGGKNRAEVHWDGSVIQPTIWFDDEKVMESGELLV
jgi:leucyl aminopeptidase (aminopeptidase T)